jgi:hypothetical protein
MSLPVKPLSALTIHRYRRSGWRYCRCRRGGGAGGGAALSSATTGFGSRCAALISISAVFSAGIDLTEIVCGANPSSEYVTVRSPAEGTCNEHGVRHSPPVDVRASAPGGVELIVKVTSFDELNRSKLGMFDDSHEQLASPSPHVKVTIKRVVSKVPPPGSGVMLRIGCRQSRAAPNVACKSRRNPSVGNVH